MDPITVLIGCSFAAVFMFACGLDLGFKMGRAITKVAQGKAELRCPSQSPWANPGKVVQCALNIGHIGAHHGTEGNGTWHQW